MRLLVAASMAKDRIAFTKGASSQEDLGAISGTVDFNPNSKVGSRRSSRIT
jgi:hypothetical protein